MPVKKTEIELDDGTKVLVRQASGREKIAIETRQARVFRAFRDYGDPLDWSEEQNEEFASAVDEAGAGIDAQVDAWLPVCVLTEDFDIDSLTSLEMYEILRWIRGDEDPEGAIPLEPSSE